MRIFTIMVILAGSAGLAGATVVFDADFQGSSAGSSNLFNATVSARNAILDNGTGVGAWDDKGASPNKLYEIAEDENGNRVLVFSSPSTASASHHLTLAEADFDQVVGLLGQDLKLSWDWMLTDESGGGSGQGLIDLLDSTDSVVATVKWQDGGALTVGGSAVGNFNRELLGTPATELSSANWNPLALELFVSSAGIEVWANGVEQATVAGSFSEVAGLRLRSFSNRTWSQGGMWIDNLHAEIVPEPAAVGLICSIGIAALAIKRIVDC